MNLSARAKLTLFFSSLFSLLLIITFGILYFRVTKSLHNDFRSEMVHDGRILAELFKEELKLKNMPEFRDEIKEFGIELQVLDQDNNVMVQSEGWDKFGIKINSELLTTIKRAPTFNEVKFNGQHFVLFSRLVHIPTQGKYSLHILRPLNSLLEILPTILWLMLLIFPLMILLSALAGFLFSGRVLEAEQSSFERLRNFTADASHELRIPLTSLRGNLEVALRKDRLAQEYKQTLQDALEEAEHLSQLTQDLLILAQTDAGKIKLNIQSMNVKNFLENVLSQAETLNNESKVQITAGPPPEGEVRFDPDRMSQLLLNLIDNAIKYSRPQGKIRIQTEIKGDQFQIIVEDDGIGIDREDLGKIFDRFFRVDKARSREQGGSGLGLSIVQWIVEAHQGRIDVESQLGKGSCFTVTLPLKGSS